MKCLKNIGMSALSVLLLSTALSAPSFANGFDGRDDHDPHYGYDHDHGNGDEMWRRLDELEHRVGELDRTVRILERRVNELMVGPPAPPVPIPPPLPAMTFCTMNDSINHTTYLGSGNSTTDADYAARSKCDQSVSSMFCTVSNAPARCDSGTAADSFSCEMEDSINHTTYRGVGRSPIEAEAQARMSCDRSVSSMFCYQPAARCSRN